MQKIIQPGYFRFKKKSQAIGRGMITRAELTINYTAVIKIAGSIGNMGHEYCKNIKARS